MTKWSGGVAFKSEFEGKTFEHMSLIKHLSMKFGGNGWL